MASGVPAPFDFACFARAMGDTSVLAGACCRVGGKRAVESRPQHMEELPSALRLMSPTSHAEHAVLTGRHCQDDLGHKEPPWKSLHLGQWRCSVPARMRRTRST